MSRVARSKLVEVAVWLALAVCAYVLTIAFDGPVRGLAIGAAFWPRAVIAGIAVAALGLLVSELRTARQPGADDLPAVEAAPSQPAGSGLREASLATNLKRLASFGIPLLYVVLIQTIGFLLATPLFLVAFMRLMGTRRWKAVVGVTAFFYLAVVLVFVRLLPTPFPQGVEPFYTLNAEYLYLIQRIGR